MSLSEEAIRAIIRGELASLMPKGNADKDFNPFLPNLPMDLAELRDRIKQLEGLADDKPDEAFEVIPFDDSSVPSHPFKVVPYGVDGGLPRVSVNPGVFIAGLHAQGYYTTPTGIGTILIDSAEEEVPTGMVEMPRTTISYIPLSSKTVILFEVNYVRKGCKAGATPDDPLTIVADPWDTDIFLKQWYCNGVAFAQSACTESAGVITLTDIAFSYLPASKVYYPIAVITTDAVGITDIRQIVRSDFREPLSGSLEAYTA
jgi:hypothetical protein